MCLCVAGKANWIFPSRFFFGLSDKLLLFHRKKKHDAPPQFVLKRTEIYSEKLYLYFLVFCSAILRNLKLKKSISMS